MTEFITVKASRNLNLMKNMPVQWNQQRRMFGTKHLKINRLQKTIK